MTQFSFLCILIAIRNLFDLDFLDLVYHSWVMTSHLVKPWTRFLSAYEKNEELVLKVLLILAALSKKLNPAFQMRQTFMIIILFPWATLLFELSQGDLWNVETFICSFYVMNMIYFQHWLICCPHWSHSCMSLLVHLLEWTMLIMWLGDTPPLLGL